jgi:glycine cleavage system H protein
MKAASDERKYDRGHGWIEMEDDFIGRCGISEQYLGTLGIIEFIDFPDIDTEIKMGEPVALLESSTHYFKYLAPVSGRITEINQLLEATPGLVNTDPYGEGWLYKIDVKEPREFVDLMFEEEYIDYIENSGDI